MEYSLFEISMEKLGAAYAGVISHHTQYIMARCNQLNGQHNSCTSNCNIWSIFLYYISITDLSASQGQKLPAHASRWLFNYGMDKGTGSKHNLPIFLHDIL